MSTLQPPASPRQLRDAFGRIPSGVVALCGLVDGRPIGMVASTFTPVSLEPALALVCIRNDSSTWQQLNNLCKIGVSVFSHTHEVACRQLARADGDRFSGINWQSNSLGAVFISDTPVWLECAIDRGIPAGDHTVVLLRVDGIGMTANTEPLVFHGSRFRHLSPS